MIRLIIYLFIHLGIIHICRGIDYHLILAAQE